MHPCGVQFGFGQGFHPYAGAGVGSRQLGATVNSLLASKSLRVLAAESLGMSEQTSPDPSQFKSADKLA